jgi:hypothetical protein
MFPQLEKKRAEDNSSSNSHYSSDDATKGRNKTEDDYPPRSEVILSSKVVLRPDLIFILEVASDKIGAEDEDKCEDERDEMVDPRTI